MKNSLLLMGDIFPTGYYCASRHLESMPTSEQESCVVAVVGCGPVGICAIAAASTWSKNIFAIDVIPDRLAEAKRIGAKPLMLNENPVAAIQAATQGRGADVVLELVGSSDAMNLCINIARQYGKISSIGLQTGPRTFDGSALYLKNLTISWGRCPVRGIFEDALACLLKVQDKVKFLCDRKVSIEDAIEAYELFNAGKVHKILVVP
jgi:threonine dehydrogenase-like Zn-dependent dehydrogenase